MRGALVCVILDPGLARRARLSPSDESADFGNEGLEVFVADLP